jgi:hypothetical protein
MAYFLLNIGGKTCNISALVPGITAAEYFVDVDPGVGYGIPVTVIPGHTVSGNFILNTTGLTPGFHNLYVRGPNLNGTVGICKQTGVSCRGDS